MVEQIVSPTRRGKQSIIQPPETVSLDEMARLVSRLQEAAMLKSTFDPPKEWMMWPEVPVSDLVHAISEHLTKTGWQQVLHSVRHHNRETPGVPWDLSRATDFLAAVESALAQFGAQELKIQPDSDRGESILDFAQNLQRQMQARVREQMSSDGAKRWLLSPRALIIRLSTRARRARTEAQIESTFSEAALYASRTAGMDAERKVALVRVDELRKQLRHQLRIFCDEQGLPLPRPYSKEEAYYLNLLNVYFVALAEAEDVITRRGAALAQRQITLEGERAAARINGKLLPGLLEAERDINPLREAYRWERARHRMALLVGSAVGAVGGALWSVVESISNVLIVGIARYAPVVAPALLVGVVTLVAQTTAHSGPLSVSVVAEFIMRAVWNAALTLGATLVVYGCWQYFTGRRRERDTSAGQSVVVKEKQDGIEAPDHVAKGNRPVEPDSDDRSASR